jgi:hypothetical protein
MAPPVVRGGQLTLSYLRHVKSACGISRKEVTVRAAAAAARQAALLPACCPPPARAPARDPAGLPRPHQAACRRCCCLGRWHPQLSRRRPRALLLPPQMWSSAALPADLAGWSPPGQAGGDPSWLKSHLLPLFCCSQAGSCCWGRWSAACAQWCGLLHQTLLLPPPQQLQGSAGSWRCSAAAWCAACWAQG